MLQLTNIVWPKKTDARYLLLTFQTIFAIYAMTFPWFARTPQQYFTMMVTCVTLDLAIAKIKTNKWIFPLSGMNATTGMFLVLDAVGVWPYLLTGIIGILSKHLIRVNDRHIFNPNNFGVLVCILAFPSIATWTMARWGGNILWVLTFIAVGLILTWLAKRLVLALSFLSFFGIFAALKSYIFNEGITFLMIPLVSPALLLYSFFIITDPRTSPDSKKEQVLFSFFVALIDTILRFYQNKNAPLLSLAIVCLLYNTLSYWKKPPPRYDS